MNNKKILLVDDDELIQTMMVPLLEAAGFEVISAYSGKPVLKLIKEQHPNIMVIDAYMDEQDGVETLLSLIEKKVPLKIVAMSYDKDMLTVMRNMGVSETFEKPLDMADVIAKLVALAEK